MHKILVLDNNMYHRDFLTRLLNNNIYQVTATGNALAAHDFIQYEKPDLIIGDFFISGLTWERGEDNKYCSIKNTNPIPIDTPLLFYSPADFTNDTPNIFQASDIADILIDSTSNTEDILSSISFVLANFSTLPPSWIENNKRQTLKLELHNVIMLLKNTLQVGKMNMWEWNLSTKKINDFGYAPPISHPQQYFTPDSMSWFYQILHPEDKPIVKTKLDELIEESKPFTTEYRIEINGKMEWVASRGNLFTDQTTHRKKCIGIWKNITDNKNKEALIKQQKEALTQIERLNSMGEITSTISHQLTQPLHIIKSYVSGCIRRIQDNMDNKDELLNALQSTSSYVDLAGDMIRSLKNFIRKGELDIRPVNINHLILQSTKLLDYQLNQHDITMDFNLFNEEINIEVDKTQLNQVFVNLVQNSIDALIDNRIIKPTIKISSKIKPNNMIEIIVSDNGHGISDEVAENLFTPCFTTKSKGMGIGLKVSRNIIEAHGGRITLVTDQNQGASFHITLPITIHAT